MNRKGFKWPKTSVDYHFSKEATSGTIKILFNVFNHAVNLNHGILVLRYSDTQLLI